MMIADWKLFSVQNIWRTLLGISIDFILFAVYSQYNVLKPISVAVIQCLHILFLCIIDNSFCILLQKQNEKPEKIIYDGSHTKTFTTSIFRCILYFIIQFSKKNGERERLYHSTFDTHGKHEHIIHTCKMQPIPMGW